VHAGTASYKPIENTDSKIYSNCCLPCQIPPVWCSHCETLHRVLTEEHIDPEEREWICIDCHKQIDSYKRCKDSYKFKEPVTPSLWETARYKLPTKTGPYNWCYEDTNWKITDIHKSKINTFNLLNDQPTFTKIYHHMVKIWTTGLTVPEDFQDDQPIPYPPDLCEPCQNPLKFCSACNCYHRKTCVKMNKVAFPEDTIPICEDCLESTKQKERCADNPYIILRAWHILPNPWDLILLMDTSEENRGYRTEQASKEIYTLSPPTVARLWKHLPLKCQNFTCAHLSLICQQNMGEVCNINVIVHQASQLHGRQFKNWLITIAYKQTLQDLLTNESTSLKQRKQFDHWTDGP
jgi:hypothetical protein